MWIKTLYFIKWFIFIFIFFLIHNLIFYLFLKEYGKLYSWGDPKQGALGHGELDYSTKL